MTIADLNTLYGLFLMLSGLLLAYHVLALRRERREFREWQAVASRMNATDPPDEDDEPTHDEGNPVGREGRP